MTDGRFFEGGCRTVFNPYVPFSLQECVTEGLRYVLITKQA